MNCKLSEDQTQSAIELLKADPRPTYAEVAKAVGSNLWAIRRLHQANTEPVDEDADSALAEFGRQISRRLPIKDRVEVVRAVAKQNKANPFVRLRAIELANEYQGMVTRKQQRETEANSQVPQPIFVLPAGAALVSVQQPLQVVVQGVSGDVPDKDRPASD